MARIVVPAAPGVTSALGLLMADPRRDYVRSRLRLLSELQPGELTDLFTDLKAQAESEFTGEGYNLDDLRLEFAVDVRYLGQGYELTIPVGESNVVSAGAVAALRQRFDETHDRMFGHSAPDEGAEAVNFRLRASALVKKAELRKRERASEPVDVARTGERPVCFDSAVGTMPCAIYGRELLAPGHEIVGPAIVEQLDSTTVVYPGQQAIVDDYLNIVISPV